MSDIKKAVLITEDNQFYISSRFEIEPEDMEEYVGFYLVTEFGDDEQFSFLSKAALDKLFVPSTPNNKDEALDNGFFEVVRR
jgi:hypothetical protein